MFRPLCGGPEDIPGVPAFEPPRPGLPPWPWRRCSAACGGESSSDANEPAGTYDVQVTDASFPTEQQLGQTSLLKLGVRNTGKKTLPALTVTVSIAGKEGQASSLPFGIRDPQTGLAQPDRPVWVLAAGYPRLAGSSSRAAPRPRTARPSPSGR